MTPLEINAITDGPMDARKGLAQVRRYLARGWVLSEASERMLRDALNDADCIRELLNEHNRKAA